MVRLTTIALIERKHDISRSLFTRYWRDVHGVMAARIPGFESYTQYHVTPLLDVGSVSVEPFEGVAIVSFANAADRAGLAHSEVSKFIRRDEENVFRRALLYNLEAGATTTRHAAAAASVAYAGPPWLAHDDSEASAFMLLPATPHVELAAIIDAVGTRDLVELHVHDLQSGDPAAWNQADVDDGGRGRRFTTVIHGRWFDTGARSTAVKQATAASGAAMVSYRVDETYRMVEAGRTTALGLRGWDALQTIIEAGANNQLEDAVTSAIYGVP